MWIEYQDGIYNTDNWKTVELVHHRNTCPESWSVIVNGQDNMYSSDHEGEVRAFYTKVKSILGVGRAKLD